MTHNPGKGFAVSERVRRIMPFRNSGMDAIDIRREADKEVRQVVVQTGISLKEARGIARKDVLKRYRIGVKYGSLDAGFESEWLKGWRGGYGA